MRGHTDETWLENQSVSQSFSHFYVSLTVYIYGGINSGEYLTLSSTTLTDPLWVNKAELKAEQATRDRLGKALKRADSNAFDDFLAAHKSAIVKWNKRSFARFIINAEKQINEYENATTPAAKKPARRLLNSLIQTYISENDVDKRWLKRLSIEPVAKERFTKKLKTKAEYQYGTHISSNNIKGALRELKRIPGYVLDLAFDLTQTPKIMRAPLKFTFKKMAIPALLIAGVTSPMLEHPIFTDYKTELAATQTGQDINACYTTIVQSGDIITMAIAHGLRDKIANNANAYSMMAAAIQGLQKDVAPIGLHAIGNNESAQGERVFNPQSSARGLFQIIDGTALDWMSRHHTKLPVLIEMRERQKDVNTPENVRLEEAALLNSIAQTIEAYKKDGDDVLRRSSRSQSIDATLNFARQSVPSAQLVIEEIRDTSPELFISNLPSDPNAAMAQIERGLKKYYQVHFSGHRGVQNLQIMASKAPQLNMHNTAQVKAAFENLGYKDASSRANNIRRSLESNEGLYKSRHSGAITAQQYINSIDAYTAQKFKPYHDMVMSNLNAVQNIDALCQQYGIEPPPQKQSISLFGMADYNTKGALSSSLNQAIVRVSDASGVPLPLITPEINAANNIPMPVPRPANLGNKPTTANAEAFAKAAPPKAAPPMPVPLPPDLRDRKIDIIASLIGKP